MTEELPFPGYAAPDQPHLISPIVENAILLRHLEYRDGLFRFVSIIKTRDSHYETVRELRIGDKGLEVSELSAEARRALAGTGRKHEAGEPIGELLSRLTGEEWSMAFFWLDLAFALSDLGRVEDLREAVRRAQRRTRWVEAADALARGELEVAAERCAEIGTLPDEAFARLLASKALSDADRHEEAERQLERAVTFHRGVGAEAYVHEAERVAAALAIGRV